MNATNILLLLGGGYLLLKGTSPATAGATAGASGSVAPVNLANALKTAAAQNTSLSNLLKQLAAGTTAKPSSGGLSAGSGSAAPSSGASKSVPSTVAPFTGGALTAAQTNWLQQAINPSNPFNQLQPIQTPGTGLIDYFDPGTYDTPGLTDAQQTLAVMDANALGAEGDISLDTGDGFSGLTDTLDSSSVPDYQIPTVDPYTGGGAEIPFDTSANGALDSTFIDPAADATWGDTYAGTYFDPSYDYAE